MDFWLATDPPFFGGPGRGTTHADHRRFGFNDVLATGTVEVDPYRVAAQIVTGIGFLGAGIIIFRRGSPHGQAGAVLTLAGSRILTAPAVLAGIDGVTSIRQLDEDPD